jgi:predicted phosphodiesterase
MTTYKNDFLIQKFDGKQRTRMTSKINFQILSDVHLEARSYIDATDLITPTTDLLVLAGDIGCFEDTDTIIKFLTGAAKSWKTVLYVPGNHEYYRKQNKGSISDLTYKFYARVFATPALRNVKILSPNRVAVVEGVSFVGCTLWSDCSKMYKLPHFISSTLKVKKHDYLGMHTRDVKWLEKVCKDETLSKIVIVTHYAPSFNLLAQNSWTKRHGCLYATNLKHLFPKVKCWIFGHTHRNVDIVENGCRLVSNQLGKKSDNCCINPLQVVSV